MPRLPLHRRLDAAGRHRHAAVLVFDDWLAWPGILVGALLVLGSLEFVGRFEEHGWTLAGTIVPIAYTAWSLWLLAAGIDLLV